MPEESRNAHMREEAAHKIYDQVITLATKHFAYQTDNQRRELAERMMTRVGDWYRPDDSTLKVVLDEMKADPDNAELFRLAPTHAQLLDALAKAMGIVDSPAARMTLHREIVDLTPDQRLERSRDLSIGNPAVTPEAASPLVQKPIDGKPAYHLMSERDLAKAVGEKLGRDPRHMLASEIRKHAEMMVQQSKPKPTPSIDAIKGKLALGKSWLDINPATRVAAEREAKDIYGKTLAELGIKTS